MLVVDEQHVLKGIITVEMVDKIRNMSTVIEDVMETDIFTVQEDSLLRDTIRKILIRGLKYVPVVDEKQILLGLITRASLVDVVYDSIWGNQEELALGNE